MGGPPMFARLKPYSTKGEEVQTSKDPCFSMGVAAFESTKLAERVRTGGAESRGRSSPATEPSVPRFRRPPQLKALQEIKPRSEGRPFRRPPPLQVRF